MMRTLLTTGIAALCLTSAAGRAGQVDESAPRYPRSRAEVPRVTIYAPPSWQPVPPPYPYTVGYWSPGAVYTPPPVGFGSRYYNGYNDPYFNSYGPGVRDFLRFGGADFYGW